ncbi:hypothetical protein NN561_008126 [Cricetulus griseus]
MCSQRQLRRRQPGRRRSLPPRSGRGVDGREDRRKDWSEPARGSPTAAEHRYWRSLLHPGHFKQWWR